MNNKNVKLYHLGSWYKAYNDDAKIVSFITNYKLFEDNKTRQLCTGFPEYVLDKVLDYLCDSKINYILPYDENKLKDFGNENNYDIFLHHNLPISYIKGNIKKITGSFIIQFENEKPIKFEIGVNINEEAELVKIVNKYNVGDIVLVNEEKVLILEKNISN